MNYYEFLDKVIDEGIDAVHVDYEKGTNKFEGAIAGFEACRMCSTEDLVELHQVATKYMNESVVDNKENYWYFRCYQAEVEWVCNVVSALMINNKLAPLLAHLPTAHGTLKAASILNENV